jgi:hypothetical protein
MIDYLVFEDLRDAKPVSVIVDTVGEIFSDTQELMFNEHPELDPDYDTALTEYYYEKEIDILNCTIQFEKESKYISDLNCSKEVKFKLFSECLDNYNNALCDIGGRIYDVDLIYSRYRVI